MRKKGLEGVWVIYNRNKCIYKIGAKKYVIC